MFTITNKQIHPKFEAVFLHARGLIPNLKLIKKKNQNHIGCVHIMKHITEIYSHFLAQKCTLEQYFNREIIIAKKQQNSEDCFIEKKIINGSPIIIVIDRKVLDLEHRNYFCWIFYLCLIIKTVKYIFWIKFLIIYDKSSVNWKNRVTLILITSTVSTKVQSYTLMMILTNDPYSDLNLIMTSTLQYPQLYSDLKHTVTSSL